MSDRESFLITRLPYTNPLAVPSDGVLQCRSSNTVDAALLPERAHSFRLNLTSKNTVGRDRGVRFLADILVADWVTTASNNSGTLSSVQDASVVSVKFYIVNNFGEKSILNDERLLGLDTRAGTAVSLGLKKPSLKRETTNGDIYKYKFNFPILSSSSDTSGNVLGGVCLTFDALPHNITEANVVSNVKYSIITASVSDSSINYSITESASNVSQYISGFMMPIPAEDLMLIF